MSLGFAWVAYRVGFDEIGADSARESKLPVATPTGCGRVAQLQVVLPGDHALL